MLIEEPQAAFYAWIDAHAADWERRVSAGQKILLRIGNDNATRLQAKLTEIRRLISKGPGAR